MEPMRKTKGRQPATEVMDSFRRIVHALRSSHRAAGDIDLTGAQLFVLATLGATTQPMSVGELAERTRTDQSTVSTVAGRLVERGLIRRARSAVDTRRVELSLTAKGRAVLRKTPTTVAQRKLADALVQLPASEAELLSRTLKKIVDMMGEADAPAAMLFDDAHTERGRRKNGGRGEHSDLEKKARKRSERT
jgi:DNA-binding MarR family transcriptional regulator